MATTREAEVELASDREIVLRRAFDAPPEMVFEVWTHAEHVSRWWGPDGFTTTTSEMDVRPGGVWRYIMHGPDGTDYPNLIAYREVVAPERLAYHHSDDPPQAGQSSFDVVVTFEPRDGGTEVTMRSVFPSREARDYVIEHFGAIEGGKQTLARLAEYLGTVPTA